MAAALTSRTALAGTRLAIRSSRLATRAIATSAPKMAIELPALPYPIDALESKGMSKRTLEFHWGKHHAAYVNNLNNQIKGKEWESLDLDTIISKSWNGGKPTPEFNNAAQIWNHTFFWECMSPNGGGLPKGKVAEAINRDFGSFEEFKKQFSAAAATQFGSGWAWLVKDGSGKLSVTKTPNAENPVVHGQTPILTIDVWEHAYYLDMQNRRPDFIANYIDNLINWDKVEERYNA